MLLCVDIGNTNTVLGLFDDRRLVCDWRIRTERNTTEDELHVLVSGLFAGIMAKPRPDILGPGLAAHAFVGGSAFLVLANGTMNALP